MSSEVMKLENGVYSLETIEDQIKYANFLISKALPSLNHLSEVSQTSPEALSRFQFSSVGRSAACPSILVHAFLINSQSSP